MSQYKITKEDIRKAERIARREADIENMTPRVRNSVQKSKKAYNRQENKRIDYAEID